MPSTVKDKLFLTDLFDLINRVFLNTHLYAKGHISKYACDITAYVNGRWMNHSMLVPVGERERTIINNAQ